MVYTLNEVIQQIQIKYLKIVIIKKVHKKMNTNKTPTEAITFMLVFSFFFSYSILLWTVS